MKFEHKTNVFGRFSWFFLAVLLFVSIYGVREYFAYQNNPRQISDHFQKELNALAEMAESKVKLLISKVDTNLQPIAHVEIENNLQTAWNDDIFLFVFRNDSLIYWNNNSVVLPPGFVHGITTTDFARELKNGWYGFHQKQAGSYCFLGCYLIKSEFPFQNEYIKNEFSSWLNICPSVLIEEKAGSYPIYSIDKNYLFSLVFDNIKSCENGSAGVIFMLFIVGSLCLFNFLLRIYSGISWFKNRDNFIVIVYGITIVLLRIVQNYSRFPAEIYQSALFSPAWYSSSALLPSLGDFTLNAIILFVLALVFYTKGSFKPISDLTPGKIFFLRNTFLTLMILLLFQAVGYFVADLITNSSLSLNLQNVSGLTFESAIGLFIIAILLFSLMLVSFKVFENIFSSNPMLLWHALSAIIVSLLVGTICWLAGGTTNYQVALFFLFYYFSFWYLKVRKTRLFSLQNVLFFLCFYAVFATYLLNKSNQIKETEKLNLLAGKLVSMRNPVTEVLYELTERKLKADPKVNQWINHKSSSETVNQDSLDRYLKMHYFKDYWKKYQVQVTFCDPTKDLRVQPQGYLINCNTYFRRIINDYGKATLLQNLFLLDYGLGKEYYLGVISGNANENNIEYQSSIFIELTLKNTYPDPGYPGLLMDNTRLDIPSRSDYSFGVFQKGLLVRAVGGNNYKMELKQYKDFSEGKPIFSEDQMVYFHYHINDTDELLISKKKDNLLSVATPFSYLFILFSSVALLVTLIVTFPKNLNFVPVSLRNRLHISLIGILLVTMLAIGVVQALNIIQINSKKNIDNLRERAYSVAIEIQHRYSLLSELQDITKVTLGDFLIKLSNVFFTDINVYSKKGILISSSRPQIFEEGLLSDRMNALACQKLIIEKSSLLIHQESIGSMQFNSAYLPFYNEHDELLGFVNLPYFAKQDESKKEISSFLVTFLNIYILLILFGVFVTVVISNYITAPLAMLAGKMSKIRLGRANEKIAWKQQDEIGQLVSEYNRMLGELDKSAEMLARSERETAWREMARQVAHEIKNPLTPMKLSVQYLEKAWVEQAPDMDQRLTRFTKTLVDQIDALSVIASDFSDFAKMQSVVLSKVNLDEIICFVLSLYQDTTKIRYDYLSEVPEPFVSGDRSQLIRLFTNLLNNAVEAIGDKEPGLIQIRIMKDRQQLMITVSDNGCGISPDRTSQIFQPNFTTKTSGMGLGLAIVKSIAEGMNGDISFTSKEQHGTTFTLKFPAYDGQD